MRKFLTRAAIAVLLAYLLTVGGLYTFQRQLMYFPSTTPDVIDPAGPAIRAITLKTKDGETLAAWWLPPKAGKPTILFFGGNGDALSTSPWRFERAAAVGVGLLAINYRGYGASTGHPTERGLHEDARAAYEFLRCTVLPRDIVIHGFSLGSGLATRLAVESPARALILEAPYTSTADVAQAAYPFIPARLIVKDQYRSRDRIGRLKMPLLIVHGDHDSVIPYRFGRQLFSMAPQPKTFVQMVGSDHNTLVRDGAYDHIWRFLGVPFAGSTAYEGRPAEAVVTGAK